MGDFEYRRGEEGVSTTDDTDDEEEPKPPFIAPFRFSPKTTPKEELVLCVKLTLVLIFLLWVVSSCVA